MDPRIVGSEIEHFLLCKAALRPHISAHDSCLGRVDELLPYLESRFPATEVQRSWIDHAVKVTDSLSMQGRDVVCLNLARIPALPRPLSPRKLKDYTEQNQPTRHSYLLAARPSQLSLTTMPQTVEVVNEGHAVARDLRIKQVIAADGIATAVRGRKLTLQLTDPQPGIYSGSVRIETNHGHLDLDVTWEGGTLPGLHGRIIDPQSLFPPHEFLDLERSIKIFEPRLLDSGYRRTVGGCYVRNDTKLHDVPTSVPPTVRWTLSAGQIAKGSLPAQGHARRIKMFAPDGSMFFEVEANGAELHGPGLLDLFELWEVKAGQKLTLEPYRGHWRAVFTDELEWLYRPAEQRTLVASVVQAEQREGFWSLLDRWISEGEFVWFLRGPGDPRIVQLAKRRPERFRFTHTAEERHPARLYVGEPHAHDWFTGDILKIKAPETTVLQARPKMVIEEQNKLEPGPEPLQPGSSDDREAIEAAFFELVRLYQPVSGNDIVNLYVDAFTESATPEDHRRIRNLFRSFAPRACRMGQLVTHSLLAVKGVLYEFYSLPEPTTVRPPVREAAEAPRRRVRGRPWKH